MKFLATYKAAALCIHLLLFSYLSVSVSFAGDFENGVKMLSEKSFSKKEQGIDLIASSGHEKASALLKAILAGEIFYVKSGDKALVTAEKEGKKYRITGYLSGEDLGLVKKRKIKKVTINNKLRTTLKTKIATLSLRHPEADVRLGAVHEILTNITPENLALLASIQELETDDKVKAALATALAVGGLYHDEPEKRLEAVQAVQGNVLPIVKNELIALIDREENNDVLKEATAILASIETKIAFYAKLETLFFGLSLGSVLVLAAIGLAITFGVIGVINMAHGELIMIGAYTTYVIQTLMPNAIGWALALSIPAAFCVSGLVGIIIEKSVIRFLYGRPLETLLATFGISLVLQQAVRSIFSPLNRSVSTPDWMSGSIIINPVLSLTTNRVVILVFAMLVFAGLFILLKKSSLGLHVRAVAQNRSMARAMGVRAARVDALTFGLGSGIAGIAGVALSQLTNVGPNLGQAYIIDSFMVVVFGGAGNLWGTLLGGLSLGVANKFLEPWSGAVLAKILILVFIILFIQKRPQGLFPQKGRAAE